MDHGTSVWRAVKYGTKDDVQEAIDKILATNSFTGAYVSFCGGDDGTSALYEAVILNDVEKVSLLLHYDADIFSRCEEGTPRDLAQELYEKNGDTHLKVLEILDKAHDDFEYQSKYGCMDRLWG